VNAKGSTRATRLPPIISVVCHHSREGWTAPIALRELIGLPAGEAAAFERYLPDFELVLDDLSQERDGAPRSRVLTALAHAAVICLTHVRGSDDVLGELRRFRDAFERVVRAESGVAALALLVGYILEATGDSPEKLRPFFKELGRRAEEAFMTGAEMLRAEGRAEGEAKGKA
jgi:hypothetical protein